MQGNMSVAGVGQDDLVIEEFGTFPAFQLRQNFCIMSELPGATDAAAYNA